MAKADLEAAIIKSIDRDPLTVVEVTALREMDTHTLMSEHGLLMDEANIVLNWCREEDLRWNAQSLYTAEADYERSVRPRGSYFPQLREGRPPKKLSRLDLRKIIREEKQRLLKKKQ